MKKFHDVLKDIEKMVGLKLQSIRPGAEITINEVVWDEERIVLRNAKGAEVSRSFSEMEGLWNVICSKPAIHVDSELGGSGSSRNQPETILANLPYVEWLKYDRKKHLAQNKNPSHPLGTLKQMDALVAEELKPLIKAEAAQTNSKGVAQVVVVSGDVATHAGMMEELSGLMGRALGQGVYEYVLPTSKFLLVSTQEVVGDIKPGTYLIVEKSVEKRPGKLVEILGEKYLSQNIDGLCLLYKM